jgi:siroheme synthase-like protein
MLDLTGRRVVIIGGGGVAARKIHDLLAAGALVSVISPELHPDLEALGERIDAHPLRYVPGMLADLRPTLVFAATDSPRINQQISEEARSLGILVNRVDDAAAGDFTSMPAVQRGDITLAISTGGASPALAAHLRETLEAAVGEEYATLARWLAELRPAVKQHGTAESRRDLWRAVLASSVLQQLKDGDQAGARAIIDALIAEANLESE